MLSLQRANPTRSNEVTFGDNSVILARDHSASRLMPLVSRQVRKQTPNHTAVDHELMAANILRSF